MATATTESSTPSSLDTCTPEEPMEQETVSLSEEAKEGEKLEAEEKPGQATQVAKSDEERQNRLMESPAFEALKAEQSGTEPVVEPKVVSAVEMENAPEPSVKVDEKPMELSDNPPTKESEVIVSEEIKKPVSPALDVDVKQVEESKVVESVKAVGEAQKHQEVSEAAFKEAGKLESVDPEVEEKLKEQSEVTRQVESESVPKVEEKPKEQSEVTQVGESESIIPKVESKPKEQSEVTEQVESEPIPEAEPKQSEVTEHVKQEPVQDQNEVAKQVELEPAVPEAESKPTGRVVEAIEKQKESLQYLLAQDTEESPESKDLDKPESTVSEVGEKPKEPSVASEEAEKPKAQVSVIPEEQSAAKEEVEKPELQDPEMVVKKKEESEGAEQVEIKLPGEKTETAASNVEVKPEEEIDVDDKVQLKECIKTGSATEVIPTDKVQCATPLNAAVEYGKKETGEVGMSEVPPKESKVEIEKNREEKEDDAKNSDNVQTSRDLPIEAPAKSSHKNSHNILTKMKQSLVKAKKAIIGKSLSSKTLVSETKGDIKVK